MKRHAKIILPRLRNHGVEDAVRVFQRRDVSVEQPLLIGHAGSQLRTPAIIYCNGQVRQRRLPIHIHCPDQGISCTQLESYLDIANHQQVRVAVHIQQQVPETEMVQSQRQDSLVR